MQPTISFDTLVKFYINNNVISQKTRSSFILIWNYKIWI